METKGSYVVVGGEGESYRFLRFGTCGGQHLLHVLFDNEEVARVFKRKVHEGCVVPAGSDFTELTRRLCDRGHDPMAVLNFMNRLLFCMLADDVGVLPDQLFTKLLESILRVLKKFNIGKNPFEKRVGELFETMSTGGFFGVYEIDKVCLKDKFTLPLEKGDIGLLLQIAQDLRRRDVWKDLWLWA